jgi:microcystin-dependent protein
MSDPYIGEIRIFGGNFAPVGWANCDGSEFSIAGNEALFQLIGTTYGGDGQSTFNVPDLQGRVPVHQGKGAGSSYTPGEQGGVEFVTLTQQQLPIHTHPLMASTAAGNNANASGNVVAADPTNQLYSQDVASMPLANNAIVPAGGSQSHENRMPFIAIRYIIALEGIFPNRG